MKQFKGLGARKSKVLNKIAIMVCNPTHFLSVTKHKAMTVQQTSFIPGGSMS